MPLGEALALAALHHFTPRCEPLDPEGDKQALEHLARACQAFSPRAGLAQWEELPEDEAAGLLLDITGVALLFGGEEALGRKVLDWIREQGYYATAAIADTVGAAWAVARYGCGRSPVPPNPSGPPVPLPPSRSLCILPPGHRLETLREFPVQALRLPEAIVDRLAAVGLQRIGQLLALPRRELAARFGSLLLRRLDQLAGREEEPIVPVPPEERWEEELVLEFPVVDREVLQRHLVKLLQQILAQVARKGRKVGRLECFLQYAGREPGAGIRWNIDLFRPTTSAIHLGDLLALHLQTLRLAAPVASIRLVIPWGVKDGGETPCFWGTGGAGKGWGEMVDRLRQRLGDQRVVEPVGVEEVQPEYAWRGVKVAEQPPEPSSPLAAAMPRPLKLFHPPLPIPVVALWPAGPPARFRWQGRPWKIQHHWGPERIETGWWRGPLIRRDYYLVETPEGQRFWIFRSLREGKWFLHGEFF